MAETITAREANHRFSRILEDVAAGREYVVTRNGVAVARIVPERTPSGERLLTRAQEDMLDSLIRTALSQTALSHTPPGDAEPAGFSRDDLYLERFERSRSGP